MWAISAMSCRFRSAFAKQQVARSQSPLGRLSQRSFPHPHHTVSSSPSQEDNPSQVCTSELIFKTCPSQLCHSILVLWPLCVCRGRCALLEGVLCLLRLTAKFHVKLHKLMACPSLCSTCLCLSNPLWPYTQLLAQPLPLLTVSNCNILCP